MNNENQLINARKQKLKLLYDLGVNPYPKSVKRTHHISDILQNPDKFIENEEELYVVGRVRALRKMGKASFFHIEDKSGRIQIYIRRDEVGRENYKVFKKSDIGDFLQIKGKVFFTNTGEISVRAKKVKFLVKSILPIPVVKEKRQDGKKVLYDQ